MTYLFSEIQEVSKNHSLNSETNPIDTNITNTDPIPVSVSHAIGDFTYVKYADATNTQLNANSRLRVSPPTQSYWYVPAVDRDNDLRYQETYSGTGAGSSFVQNLAKIRCSSGTDAGGTFLRASRRRHKMRPGVSLEWFATMNWNGVQPNVIKRRGFYTQYNGVFIEITHDMHLVIRRRLQDGTLVEKQIDRVDFTHDKLNGLKSSSYTLNPSGYNLDPVSSNKTYNITGYVSKTGPIIPQNSTEAYYNVTFSVVGEPSNNIVAWELGEHVLVGGLAPSGYNQKAMLVAKSAGSITLSYFSDPGTNTDGTGTVQSDGLFKLYTWWFDFDGDRTTRLRFGVLAADGPQICHIEDFSGQMGVKWSSAPSMPDRMEILNTGAVSYVPTMYIGSTCINVEAETELSPSFAVAENNTGVTFQKQSTEEFAVLGIGLRWGEPYQRGDIQIQGVQLLDIANVNPQNAGPFYWRLILNPTITAGNPTPTNAGKASQVWQYTTSTTWTGGIPLTGGYFTSSTMNDVRTALNFLNLGSNPTNTGADFVVLVVKHLAGGSAGGSANPNIVGAIQFIESL